MPGSRLKTISHPWDVTPAEARRIQDGLRPLVEDVDRLGPVRHVAGVDVHFPRPGAARAAAVVLDAETLELEHRAVAECPLTFPYVPGLLSFREVPAALAALGRLEVAPDLLLCDGQGLAHPRRLGLASHLGLLLDLPTIGAAKTRLVGSHDEPPLQRGGQAALVLDGERVGTVLRTRSGVRPLYVSVGHRVSLETAVRWVLHCAPRYRLPETTRLAHGLASGAEPSGAEDVKSET